MPPEPRIITFVNITDPSSPHTALFCGDDGRAASLQLRDLLSGLTCAYASGDYTFLSIRGNAATTSFRVSIRREPSILVETL